MIQKMPQISVDQSRTITTFVTNAYIQTAKIDCSILAPDWAWSQEHGSEENPPPF